MKKNLTNTLMEEAKKMSEFSGIPSEDCYMVLNPNEEGDTVLFIKEYLLAEDQRSWLFEYNLSIEDILNGRFGALLESYVDNMLEEWNKKLGKKLFGF